MKESEKVFFDTNIIVYAYDIAEEEKRSACSKIFSQVFTAELTGIISNQVLAEVFYILTKKVKKPLAGEEAKKIIFNLVKSEKWSKISYDEYTLEKAIDTSINLKIDLWDALIAETMKENGISTIITENEKDFKKVLGIKVINPFKK